ncbi:PTS system mannose/fructose/sorbose family transporter subunit IID [Olsenella sp. Marseille-P4559]|uniref:PTS system mannose/fructose/sorbose family transporter subunit IID n=1 Tax=Olsenella sp. Marseille-P4559 TaxID=2364795 RepID=UPI001A92CA5D|nr:PTS system mannose/fructose/sorbose family transporter subunit IID [Olsenella sp. Marseille-P4559]
MSEEKNGQEVATAATGTSEKTFSNDYHDYLNADGIIEGNPALMLGDENAPEEITKHDLLHAWFRGWWANEVPHSFDRMIAPAFLFGLMPILQKLYKNKVMLGEAYQRHMVFFNTQAIWGQGLITGIVASLEEERAKALHEGRVEDAIGPQIINATKVGLMGPLAGIGDSIDSGTVQYIFIAMFLPLAQQGSAWGALLPWICFTAATFIYGFAFVRLGYKMGRRAALEVMKGSKIKAVIDGLGVLGLFMMGILAASYVKVSTPISFELSGKTFAIQTILNGILPGFLPLLAVVFLYLYFKKNGLKITKAMIIYTIVLLALGLVNVL